MRNYFLKTFFALNTGMGIYGFTRGYRSRSKFDNGDDNGDMNLMTYKMMYGMVNSILYMIPPWNIYYFTKLVNRIEIQKRGLDKTMYENEYNEHCGICSETY